MSASVIAQAVAAGRLVAVKYRDDTYQIMRPTTTPDDAGGWETTEAVWESGGCILTAGATRPEEREMAARLESVVPIIVRNMPHTTSLKASDTLVINGTRRLEVLGVLRAEAANAAVTAICEERG